MSGARKSMTWRAAATPVCRAAVVYSVFFQAEDGIRDLTVTGVQTCALPIFDFPHIQHDGGIERNHHGPRYLSRIAQRANQRVLSAPCAPRFYFQVKYHVIFFGELQDFFQCGDALSGEFAPEPRPGIQPPQIGKRHVVYRALSVRGAIHGGVVNGHEVRIARKLQIRFDERSPKRNGFPERRQRVFRRVPRGPTMRNHQHYATLSAAIILDPTPPLSKSFSLRKNPMLPSSLSRVC